MNEGESQTTVILFKTVDVHPSYEDPYAVALAEAGVRDSRFVPVLEHGAVHMEELRHKIQQGPVKLGVGGVIVTSRRAGEMWMKAGSQIVEHLHDWRKIPFYVVGNTTAGVFLSPTTASFPYIPTVILGADESGTGEKLANFIGSDYPHRSTSWTEGHSMLPLLHLMGDKTTGTLRAILDTHGIPTDTLQVYRTWQRHEDDFVANFNRLSLPSHSTDRTWLVFFAPSAAKAVLPILKRYLTLPYGNHQPQPPLPGAPGPLVSIAAIGPTTAKYLVEVEGLLVTVVPSKPDASSLAASIASVGEQMETAVDSI